MVSMTALWLPILVSAVAVFIVSSVIHMVLGYHQSDYSALPAEGEIADALRPHGLPPGDYIVPHGEGMKALSDPDYIDRATRGPNALITVLPNGLPSMARPLILWFLFCVLVGGFAAYVSGRALGPGAHYLEVFRFAGAAAFGGYALALIEDSIWYHRKWSTTAKNVFDGLVYALVTAGVFGWLWPGA